MKVAVLTPNWNDWESVALLLRDLDKEFSKTSHIVSVFIVDDGSFQKEPEAFRRKYSSIEFIEIIYLNGNFGHQRALAIGIGHLLDHKTEFDAILVMDSDGEDSPEAARKMVHIAASKNQNFLVASRAKRNESFVFRLSYFFYKMFFYLGTGKIMDFGNFMFFRKEVLQTIAFSQHTGSHLAASILKSRLSYESVPFNRESRYLGKSKMGFVGLIVHGLSAISVFTEVVLSRCLVALVTLSFSTICGMLLVFCIRIFTDLAIPGWATYVSLVLLVLLVQSLLGIVFLCFLALTSRQSNPWIPALHYKPFILKSERY